jgi:hypothetical protein
VVHPGRWSTDLWPQFNEDERVCDLLISTVQSGTGGSDRAAEASTTSVAVLGAARRPVAPSRLGLYLRSLRRPWRGRDRLVMRMWTQRMSVRSVGWRACGAHLALVLLLATAVVAPLP